jgi:hypothetical protein
MLIRSCVEDDVDPGRRDETFHALPVGDLGNTILGADLCSGMPNLLLKEEVADDGYNA